MSLRRLIEGVERSNDFLSAQAAWKHGARTDEFYRKYGRTLEKILKTSPDFSGAEEESAVLEESTSTRVKTEEDLTPTLAVKERRQKKFGQLMKSEGNVVIRRRESHHRQSSSPHRRRSRSRDRRRKRERGHSGRHTNGRKRRRRSNGPPMRFPTPPRVLTKELTSDSSFSSESGSHGKAPIKELADSGEALAKNPRILSALADLIMQRRGLKKLLPGKKTAIFQPTSQENYSTPVSNFHGRRTVGPLEIGDTPTQRGIKNDQPCKPKKEEVVQQEQSIENMRFTTVNEGPLHKPKLTDIFDRLEDT